MTLYLRSFKPFTSHITANHQHPTLTRLLHVAPENALARWLRKLPHLHYIGSDLQAWDYTASNVHLYTDLTYLAFAPASFDFIICNHVLEHIKKDRLAICELYRVLKPGGYAFISVPVKMRELTYEDTDIRAPEDRAIAFEQEDHVRVYGRDIINRLQAPGFTVMPISSLDIPAEQASRYGLLRHENGQVREEIIFTCHKPDEGS